MSMFDYKSDKTSPGSRSDRVPVSRERMAILEFISNVDSRLAGTNLEWQMVEDMASRGRFYELSAILYGLDSDKVTELPAVDSDWTTVEVPDLDDPPRMPATWWDHVKWSLGNTLLHFFSRKKTVADLIDALDDNVPSAVRWQVRCCAWLLSRVNWTTLPVATKPLRIRTVRRFQRRFVCPHAGLGVPADRHTVFLMGMRRTEDCGARMMIERILAVFDENPDAFRADGHGMIDALHRIRLIIEHYKRSNDEGSIF